MITSVNRVYDDISNSKYYVITGQDYPVVLKQYSTAVPPLIIYLNINSDYIC